MVQVATVFVFSLLALLTTRILLGAGEGPSYGTSVSAATPWLPADRRAFGLAIVTFGSAIGPAIFAPPLTFLIVVVDGAQLLRCLEYRYSLGDHLAAGWARVSRNEAHARR